MRAHSPLSDTFLWRVCWRASVWRGLTACPRALGLGSDDIMKLLLQGQEVSGVSASSRVWQDAQAILARRVNSDPCAARRVDMGVRSDEVDVQLFMRRYVNTPSMQCGELTATNAGFGQPEDKVLNSIFYGHFELQGTNREQAAMSSPPCHATGQSAESRTDGAKGQRRTGCGIRSNGWNRLPTGHS